MFIESASSDPVIHFRSIRLARRLTDKIIGLLRPEEVRICLEEFYREIRVELESGEK